MPENLRLPVTVAVRRTARPERSGALVAWARELCTAAREYSGFMDATVRERELIESVEVVIGVTFDSSESLIAWERSDERKSRLEFGNWVTDGPVVGLTVADVDWGMSGGRPGEVAVAPPRWKTAVVVWLALFPAALAVNLFLMPRLPDLPAVAATLVSSLVLVPFVVWVGVPLVHRVWDRFVDRARRRTA